MKINYSFKLSIALFLLANLDILGAAEDESGFSPAVEQLDLSFLDRLDLRFLDRHCQICDIFFDDNDSFKEHLSSHEFPIQAEETDDNKGDDLKRRFKCGQCGKPFAYNAYLKVHERVHTGEKPYKCDQCGKSFTQRSHLKSHERIHTGEKLYQCNQCEKSFTHNCHLKSHERIHTGEKPYQCNQCEKSFTRSYNLKVHKKIHAKQASQVQEDDHE